MPLNGYDVNPGGCASVLAQIEDDPARPEAVASLRDGVEEAEFACMGGSGTVGRALAELWQDTMAQQIDAAEIRILNAVNGVREAVSVIAGADREMADAARASLAEIQAGMYAAPRLEDRR